MRIRTISWFLAYFLPVRSSRRSTINTGGRGEIVVLAYLHSSVAPPQRRTSDGAGGRLVPRARDFEKIASKEISSARKVVCTGDPPPPALGMANEKVYEDIA